MAARQRPAPSRQASAAQSAGRQPAPGPADLFERIYRVVRQVPRGQVATYGQIALVVGAPTPRIVGFALSALSDGSQVPWQRVINSQGQVSARKDGGADGQQRRRLEAEGVRFDAKDRVDFASVAWRGPPLHWLARNGFDIEEIASRSQRKRRINAWCRWPF